MLKKKACPVTEFDIRARLGFLIRVKLWPTRRLLHRHSFIARREGVTLHGATYSDGHKKIAATIHLCVQSLDDNTIEHEAYHAICALERRCHDYFDGDLEEAMARDLCRVIGRVKKRTQEYRA